MDEFRLKEDSFERSALHGKNVRNYKILIRTLRRDQKALVLLTPPYP